MKKSILMLLFCAVPIFTMAQDVMVVAQPVVCMIQSDAVCGIAGSPVSIIQNSSDADFIVRGGTLFPLTDKDEATGVECIKEIKNTSDKKETIGYYSIDGKRLSQPQNGLNILRMSDGTTRKGVR